MISDRLQMLFIVGVALFFMILAIDFSTREPDGIVTGPGITPAEEDFQRRMHRARIDWCNLWAVKGKVGECKEQSLLELKEAIGGRLPGDAEG